MRKKTLYIELIILFALSLLPLFWLKPGEVIMGHDSGFRLNFLYYYKSLLYAWNPVVNFGVDWQLYKGFLLTQLPEFIGTVVTGSWVIGQRMMMVFWFFVMQLSMYLLARTIKPEKEHWVFRMTAAIFYAFNFFILQAWFIVERAKFSLYAALPLSILLLYLVFEKKRPVIRHAVLFGLLYFFASGGGSPPLYGATIVVWIITVAYFSLLHWKERKIHGILFGLKVAFLFGLAFFLINAYWIIPQIGLYLSTYKLAVALRGGIDGLIAWERVNSKNASILNLLRLQGIPDWYDNPNNPFSTVFLHNPILVVASFIPIGTIVLGFIITAIRKVRHNSLVWLACILLVVGLLLSGGSHRPFGIIFEYAMRHVPGFAIFRSSFYKFGPLVWFSVIFLFAYFADKLIPKKILRICIVVGVLVYHYPFFTANIFQFDKQFSTKVRIPTYVENMAAFANADTDPGTRIMVLPELTPSFYNVQMDSYTWKFFSLDILPRNTINRSIIANDNNAPDAIFRLYTEFMDGDQKTFMTIARYMEIRYILWRDDAVYSRSVVDGRTIDFQKNRLATFGFKRIFSAGAWELYDLGEQTPLPDVWAPQDIARSSHAIEHPLDFLLTSASSSSAVLEGIRLPDDVLEASCVYCELGVYDKMVRETPEPSLRFKPGSLLFSRLLALDKKAILSAGSNPEALFNAMIAHSQFQLAILSSTDKPKGYDKQAIITDVETSFATAREQIKKLSGRQKNVYLLRLLLYIDVSDRFYPGLSFLPAMRDEIKPLVWMTQNSNDIRYEFETREDDTYSVVVTNVTRPPGSIEIDGVRYQDSRDITIPAGYHTARIQYPPTARGFAPQLFLTKPGFTRITPPTITFTKINPTKYTVHVTNAQGPFVLVLNEAYDPRWIVNVPSDHGKANGFGNAWTITKTGEYTVSLTYRPQQLFIIGAAVSGISLLLGLILIIRQRRR